MTNENTTVKKIYSKAVEQMEQNICREFTQDEVYLKDGQDLQALEERVQALPILTEHRWVLNDHYACMMSQMSRAIELAYLAGVRTSLELIGKNPA